MVLPIARVVQLLNEAQGQCRASAAGCGAWQPSFCVLSLVCVVLCSAMTKTLDSTAVYAYTTLISAIVCLPFALIAEGSVLQAGAAAAIQKVGGHLADRASIEQ